MIYYRHAEFDLGHWTRLILALDEEGREAGRHAERSCDGEAPYADGVLKDRGTLSRAYKTAIAAPVLEACQAPLLPWHRPGRPGKVTYRQASM